MRGMQNHVCRLCLTPYRSEIMKAWKEGIKKKLIFEKYAPLMNYDGNWKAWYALANRHMKEHKATGMVSVSPPDSAIVITPTTIEGFGQKMLELGVRKIENATPEEIALKDVIQAQKLVLDSKKLKMTEDALGLMLGKLFAPPVVEGEIIEDRTGRIETSGIK